MKTLEITFLALFLAVTGCVTNPQNSASSNMSDFKNPDPKIEAMHVEAYNMDLGIGVPQDREKANELYLQAALAGDPRSMLNLGVNLIDGEGIKRDEIEGIAWLEVARFITRQTQDMTTKWRIRGALDHYKAGFSDETLKSAESRAKKLLEQVSVGNAGKPRA